MLVIIGGSGMLLEASQALAKKSCDDLILCSRRLSPYEPILQENPKAEFLTFDFSNEEHYERLRIELIKKKKELTFLIWIHSPYYPYLEKLLLALRKSIKAVYLVKGSNSHPLPKNWKQDFPLKVIQLDKHPTEDRWLTHHEISQKVLAAMACRTDELNQSN